MSSPCFNCADRELGCHAWCDSYRSYAYANAEKNKESRLYNASRDYQIRMLERIRKRERLKRK
jgi:hypothetical protein